MAKRVIKANGKEYVYESTEIYNIQPEVLHDLRNIAKNLGSDLSSLIKPKLRELRDSYPVNMRQDPNAA
jgi:hypothetical protein